VWKRASYNHKNPTKKANTFPDEIIDELIRISYSSGNSQKAKVPAFGGRMGSDCGPTAKHVGLKKVTTKDCKREGGGTH